MRRWFWVSLLGVMAVLVSGPVFAETAEELQLRFQQALASADTTALTAALTDGADINAREGSSQATALMRVSGTVMSSLDMVRALLEHGADPGLRDRRGRDALMQAADSVADEAGAIMALLLERQPDCRAHDDDGQTALMLAAGQDHPERLHALLACGADIDAKDRQGRTALHYAALGNWRGDDRLQRLGLVTASRASLTDMLAAVLSRGQSVDRAEVLLAAGADGMATAVLAGAVAGERWSFLQKELQAGASPDAVHDGEPLLMLALKQQTPDMLRLLLQYRARVNGVGSSMGGPLEYLCAHASPERREPFFRMLAAAGASLDGNMRYGIPLREYLRAEGCGEYLAFWKKSRAVLRQEALLDHITPERLAAGRPSLVGRWKNDDDGIMNGLQLLVDGHGRFQRSVDGKDALFGFAPKPAAGNWRVEGLRFIQRYDDTGRETSLYVAALDEGRLVLFSDAAVSSVGGFHHYRLMPVDGKRISAADALQPASGISVWQSEGEWHIGTRPAAGQSARPLPVPASRLALKVDVAALPDAAVTCRQAVANLQAGFGMVRELAESGGMEPGMVSEMEGRLGSMQQDCVSGFDTMSGPDREMLLCLARGEGGMVALLCLAERDLRKEKKIP